MPTAVDVQQHARQRPPLAPFAMHSALAPAPHLPVADADDLGRLPPRDLLGHSPQNYFLYFHCPLHRGLAVNHHAGHDRLLSPLAERTFHLLTQPDISCASNMPWVFA